MQHFTQFLRKSGNVDIFRMNSTYWTVLNKANSTAQSLIPHTAASKQTKQLTNDLQIGNQLSRCWAGIDIAGSLPCIFWRSSSASRVAILFIRSETIVYIVSVYLLLWYYYTVSSSLFVNIRNVERLTLGVFTETFMSFNQKDCIYKH